MCLSSSSPGFDFFEDRPLIAQLTRILQLTNKQTHLDVVDVERVLLVLAGQNHKDWLRARPPQVDELHRKVAWGFRQVEVLIELR